jgi:hypothetical protein
VHLNAELHLDDFHDLTAHNALVLTGMREQSAWFCGERCMFLPSAHFRHLSR